MAAITREILRDELAGFATDIIQKELANFKNEFLLEMRKDLGARVAQQERQSSDDSRVDWAGASASERDTAVPFDRLHASRDDGYMQLRQDSPEDLPDCKPEERRASIASRRSVLTEDEASQSRSMLERFVRSSGFDRFILSVIMLNIAAFVLEIDYLAQHWETTPPSYFFDFELVTLLIFSFEITLRIKVDGLDFFIGSRFVNNLFDLSLVLLQTCEVALQFLKLESESSLNILKILRVTRVFRAGRIINMIPALHILFSSIASSVESLVWIMLLVLLTVGSFAVVLTQMVTEHKVTKEREAPGQEVLEENFGSVGRAMLRLYQVMTEGTHWGELAEPLMIHVTPWSGIIFVAYSAFITFTLLNVVTAVFVESAVAEAQQDHQSNISNRIWKIFEHDLFVDPNQELTESQFNSRIGSPALQDYLRKLGMGPERAKEQGLFHLLDQDRNGTVSCKEILEECARLLGYARAVDVAILRREVYVANMESREHRKHLDGIFQLLLDKLR